MQMFQFLYHSATLEKHHCIMIQKTDRTIWKMKSTYSRFHFPKVAIPRKYAAQIYYVVYNILL